MTIVLFMKIGFFPGSSGGKMLNFPSHCIVIKPDPAPSLSLFSCSDPRHVVIHSYYNKDFDLTWKNTCTRTLRIPLADYEKLTSSAVKLTHGKIAKSTSKRAHRTWFPVGRSTSVIPTTFSQSKMEAFSIVVTEEEKSVVDRPEKRNISALHFVNSKIIQLATLHCILLHLHKRTTSYKQMLLYAHEKWH